MKIKKFVAATEAMAIEQIKDEFGMDALVLNIKKVQPRGIFAFFKSQQVEVTAAYDDTELGRTSGESIEIKERKIESGAEKKPNIQNIGNSQDVNNDRNIQSVKADLIAAAKSAEMAIASSRAAQKGGKSESEIVLSQSKEIAALQEMLVTKEETIRRVEKQLMVSSYKIIEGRRKYRNNIVQVFYDTLLRQGVKDDIAEYILKDLDLVEENDQIDINFIVRIVYNKIIDIIGDTEIVSGAVNESGITMKTGEKGKPWVVAFIGPTGVGKTTTIAKISADLILNNARSVGLITADTYRIAAVEQLKVYADILGVEIGVVYSPEDLAEYIKVLGEVNDTLLIDTAGRSHKHDENLRELKAMLDSAPGCEIFLTISLTTKYEDMLDIVTTYSAITDFSIIFTKLDETLSLGSVINLCYDTGKKISHITFGQNVPDDIRSFTAEEVARAVLSQF